MSILLFIKQKIYYLFVFLKRFICGEYLIHKKQVSFIGCVEVGLSHMQ